MIKVLSIVGARPQFVKAAPVSRALRQSGFTESLVHTGQHYDPSMSDVFFAELGIPEPDVNLNVGSGTHGVQTGAMLPALEQIIWQQRPKLNGQNFWTWDGIDWLLRFQPTTSPAQFWKRAAAWENSRIPMVTAVPQKKSRRFCKDSGRNRTAHRESPNRLETSEYE